MIKIRRNSEIPNDLITASQKRFVGNASTHIHEFFEIEYIIDGKGICKIDGCEYKIKKGTLFLLTPTNTHEIISADAELINVMFRCEFGNDILHIPTFCDPYFELNAGDQDFVRAVLTELCGVYENDITYAHMLLQCVIQKLSYYPTVTADTSLPYIQRTILYVTENFRYGISLNDAAAQVGLCPTYLSELFSDQMGMTFKNYLDNVRFSYAKNLLTFTDLPICDVCKYAGFGDYANFSRRFKALFDLTPTEYRKRKTYT